MSSPNKLVEIEILHFSSILPFNTFGAALLDPSGSFMRLGELKHLMGFRISLGQNILI